MMLASMIFALLAGPSAELDVVYSKAGGEELRMDVYSPSSTSEGLRPAVVVIHGGAWMSGKRQDMAQLASALAESGFVAATVSYRLAPKHKWPAMLDDVQSAVRFLRANAPKYRVDPKRIGSAGASAGGHLAMMLGFRDTRDLSPSEFPQQSSKVAAVFNIFGPTDMRRDFPATLDFLFQAVLGKPKSQAAKEIEDASPVAHLNRSAAPVFTIHGKADPLVPFAQATWLDQNLKKAGVVHEMVLVDGMGHSIDLQKPEVADAIKRALTFLKDRLGAATSKLVVR